LVSVIARSAEVMIVVSVLAALLPGSESAVSLVAVAVAVITPGKVEAGTDTVIVALWLVIGAVAPAQVQVTVVVPRQLPPTAVADTKSTPAGSGSEKRAFCASEGPLLVSVAV
jgi:hypothetical protein